MLCHTEVGSFMKLCTWSCSFFSKMKVYSAKILAFHRGAKVILFSSSRSYLQEISSKHDLVLFVSYVLLTTILEGWGKDFSFIRKTYQTFWTGKKASESAATIQQQCDPAASFKLRIIWETSKFRLYFVFQCTLLPLETR